MSDPVIAPVATNTMAVVADRRQRQDQHGQRHPPRPEAETAGPETGAGPAQPAAAVAAPADDETPPVDAGTLFAAALLANRAPAPAMGASLPQGHPASAEWTPPDTVTRLTDRTV